MEDGDTVGVEAEPGQDLRGVGARLGRGPAGRTEEVAAHRVRGGPFQRAEHGMGPAGEPAGGEQPGTDGRIGGPGLPDRAVAGGGQQPLRLGGVRAGRPGRAAERFAMVPQGTGVFPRLTVEENVRLGLVAGGAAARRGAAERIAAAQRHLPALVPRWRSRAGDLSGGRRQMVSIARAPVSGSPVLLLDGPSVGLAPKLVEDMRDRPALTGRPVRRGHRSG